MQDRITNYELNVPIFNQGNEVFYKFGQSEYESKPSWNIGGQIFKIKLFDIVRVYKWPSSESNIINTLQRNTDVDIIGVAGKMEIINGYEEYWIGITWGENNHGPQNYGWVQSSNLKLEDVFFSEISIISTSTNDQENLILNVIYTINDIESEFSIFPEKQENNNYTFFWDYRNDNFHYSSKPGLYVWNDETKELKHLSYIISDGYLNWQHIVTNNFEYLILYKEIENSIGNINVWQIDDGEIILFGKIYDKFSLNENTLEIVKYYDVLYSSGWRNHEGEDNWMYGNRLSAEEIEFAGYYLEKNEVPEEYLDHVNQIPGINAVLFFIVVERNIETSEEKITGCIYIPVQI